MMKYPHIRVRMALALVLMAMVIACSGPSVKRPVGVDTSIDSLLTLADTLNKQLRTSEAVSCQMKAYMRARSDRQKARVQVALARSHYSMGDMSISREFIEQSVRYYDTATVVDDSMMDSKIDAMMFYSKLLTSLGQSSASVKNYSRVADFAKNSGNIFSYIDAQMHVLHAEEVSGNYAAAIEGYRDLLQVCVPSKYGKQRFMVLNALNRLFLSLGNSREAGIYLHEMKILSSGSDVDVFMVDIADMRQSVLVKDSVRMRTCVNRLRVDVVNQSLLDYYDYNAFGLLGEYYLGCHMYDSARYYINKFYKLTTDDDRKVVGAYANLIKAQSLLIDHKMDSVHNILFNGLMGDVCARNIELAGRYYRLLSDYYYKIGDFNNSYLFMRRSTQMTDSVNAEVLSQNLAYRDMAYQRDTTILSNNIKSGQLQSRIDTLAFWQMVWIMIIVVAVIVVVIFVLHLGNKMQTEREKEIYHQNRMLQHEVVRQTSILQTQKMELENTNERLTKEIEYASRIQRDILPMESEMDCASLKGHFIFYRPCSHISGDFYWFHDDGKRLYICCADATGHGIPGAFVAMVCSTILNDVISKPDQSVSTIMTELDSNLRNILLNNEHAHGNDSVDMTIACLDYVSGKVTLSLARHNAYIVRADGSVERIQGIKRSIGEVEETFVSREYQDFDVNLADGDMLYLTTDGLESQFGGPDNKKMKRTRMMNYMSEIANAPVEHQYRALNDIFYKWKGDNEQTDDVLVIGLCYKDIHVS